MMTILYTLILFLILVEHDSRAFCHRIGNLLLKLLSYFSELKAILQFVMLPVMPIYSVHNHLKGSSA